MVDDVSAMQTAAPVLSDISGILIGDQNDYNTLDYTASVGDPPADVDYKGVGFEGDINGTFNVYGTGADLWGGCDSTFYAYSTQQVLPGNFDISYTMEDFYSQDGGSSAEWGRAGLLIRDTLDCRDPIEFLGVSLRGYPRQPQPTSLDPFFQGF